MASLPSNFPTGWYAWLEANAARYLLFARSQTRSEADAQDVLQEALLEAWRRAPDLPPGDTLIFKTIRWRAIDLGRRADLRARHELNTVDWWQSSEDAPGTRNLELEGAVQALPAHLREVVLLKIWGGLTFRDIAETLGLPPATAASRYRYALEHLRHALKEVRT